MTFLSGLRGVLAVVSRRTPAFRDMSETSWTQKHMTRMPDGKLIPNSVIHVDGYRQSYSHARVMEEIELGYVVAMAQEMEDLGMGKLLDAHLLVHERAHP